MPDREIPVFCPKCDRDQIAKRHQIDQWICTVCGFVGHMTCTDYEKLPDDPRDGASLIMNELIVLLDKYHPDPESEDYKLVWTFVNFMLTMTGIYLNAPVDIQDDFIKMIQAHQNRADIEMKRRHAQKN